MGRKRVISEDQVLDAAQYVVVEKGAAGLTIEAVASQAGISKASVLYYYKSKRALIKAVVDRMVLADAAINETAISGLQGGEGAAVRGRIRASSKGVTDQLRSIALNLCASVAKDAQLRRTGKDYMHRTVERIKTTCEHPRGAMLAFLALEGVKLLELVDWHTWTDKERKSLLRDIEWLIEVDPQEPKQPIISVATKSAAKSARSSTAGTHKKSKVTSTGGAAKNRGTATKRSPTSKHREHELSKHHMAH